jgi:hypothetical protein
MRVGEQAGLEDELHGPAVGGLHDGAHVRERDGVILAFERVERDHRVDLGGAEAHRFASLEGLGRSQARAEREAHDGDGAGGRALEEGAGECQVARVEADGGKTVRARFFAEAADVFLRCIGFEQSVIDDGGEGSR